MRQLQSLASSRLRVCIATMRLSSLIGTILWFYCVTVDVMNCTTKFHTYHMAEETLLSTGSNLTLISDVTNPGNTGLVTMFARTAEYHRSDLGEIIATIDYHTDWPVFFKIRPDDGKYTGLEIRFAEINSPTKKILWTFNYLPESYNGLILNTVLYTKHNHLNQVESTTLNVSACPSLKTVNTVGQNNKFTITSKSPGHFNDKGQCSCPENQFLFNMNGTRHNGNAICGPFAAWIGCENVQCWSAPHKVKSLQHAFNVNGTDPFRCNFKQGFPKVKKVAFKINDAIISRAYRLKSSDNRKLFSCVVYSDFTEAMKEKYESRPEQLIVYFPPESLILSDYSPKIEMHSFKIVEVRFSANIKKGARFSLSVRNKLGDDAGHMFSWTYKRLLIQYDRYVYHLNIAMTSEKHYGSYDICVQSKKPDRGACSTITIFNSNATGATLNASASSNEFDGDSSEGERHVTIAVLTIVGVVIGVLLIAFMFVCIRKRILNGRDGQDGDDQGIGQSVSRPQQESAPDTDSDAGAAVSTIVDATGNNAVNDSPGSFHRDEDADEESPTIVVDDRITAFKNQEPTYAGLRYQADQKYTIHDNANTHDGLSQSPEFALAKNIAGYQRDEVGFHGVITYDEEAPEPKTMKLANYPLPTVMEEPEDIDDDKSISFEERDGDIQPKDHVRPTNEKNKPRENAVTNNRVHGQAKPSNEFASNDIELALMDDMKPASVVEGYKKYGGSSDIITSATPEPMYAKIDLVKKWHDRRIRDQPPPLPPRTVEMYQFLGEELPADPSFAIYDDGEVDENAKFLKELGEAAERIRCLKQNRTKKSEKEIAKAMDKIRRLENREKKIPGNGNRQSRSQAEIRDLFLPNHLEETVESFVLYC